MTIPNQILYKFFSENRKEVIIDELSEFLAYFREIPEVGPIHIKGTKNGSQGLEIDYSSWNRKVAGYPISINQVDWSGDLCLVNMYFTEIPHLEVRSHDFVFEADFVKNSLMEGYFDYTYDIKNGHRIEGNSAVLYLQGKRLLVQALEERARKVPTRALLRDEKFIKKNRFKDYYQLPVFSFRNFEADYRSMAKEDPTLFKRNKMYRSELEQHVREIDELIASTDADNMFLRELGIAQS